MRNALATLSAVLALVAAVMLFSTPAPAASGEPPRATGGFLDPHDQMYPMPSYLSLMVQRADRVRGRIAGRSAFGRLAPHTTNSIRPGKVWDFGHVKRDRTPQMKRFLDAVFERYERDGEVNLRVRTWGDGGRSDWRCRLTERTDESRCRPR